MTSATEDEEYREETMIVLARLPEDIVELRCGPPYMRARESALPEAHRLHVEILAKLRDLNPSKVFGLNENMLQRLWRRFFGGRLTVEQVFARHYPQVEALASALDALEPTLANQLSGLGALSQRYDQLNTEISGYILAVRYIYGYIYGDDVPPEKRALYISHIDAIMDRQDSLRITQVTG